MDIQKAPQRELSGTFDALQLGSGWEERISGNLRSCWRTPLATAIRSMHLAGIMEQAKYGVFETGGFPDQYHTTDICDRCAGT